MAQAWQLSKEIDGHPLGLLLLGKAFNGSPIALAAFLADHETYLLAAENRYIGVEHRQRKLYANFAYSVRWLTPELRDTLSQLWIFHAPFRPEIAVKVLDPAHDKNALEPSPVEAHLYTLWQRGLLTREALNLGNETQHLYRLPPVMRPYIEHHLADVDKREETLKRFGEALAGLAKTIHIALVGGRAIAALAVQCYDDLARGVSYVEGVEQGRYLSRWGGILHWIGDQAESIAMTEQALAILREVGDRASEGTTLNNLGHVYDDLGQKAKALDYFEQALAIHREVGNRAVEGTTLNNLGMVYDALGQMPKALDYYEQALTIAREVDNRAGEGTTLNNLGHVYDALGQVPRALDYYEQALIILREVSNRAVEGTTLNNLGKVYRTLGQKSKALDYYEQALAIHREVGNRAVEGTTLHNIGIIYANNGRLDVALACVLLAKALFEHVQSPSSIENAVQVMDALRTYLGEQQFALLFAQVEPRAGEIVEGALRERRVVGKAERGDGGEASAGGTGDGA